jgi:DNA mismatch endonuclease (patch repair protein)
MPNSNIEFWQKKLQRNRERDQKVNRELKKVGWRIVRVWQHELKDPTRVAQKLVRSLTQ